jgi:hypothetical protein
MRINYFVGIEGTHSLVFNVLQMDPRTEVFETFIGPRARQRMHLPIAEILTWVFGADRMDSEELNMGISKTGAAGEMLTNLWDNSPAGSRIFFFKSSDDAINIDRHASYLKVSPNRDRIERVTGIAEESIESDPDAYNAVAIQSLATMNGVADAYNASAWAPFDINCFFGDPAGPDSKLLFRLVTKV